jgi:hypothetical protein
MYAVVSTQLKAFGKEPFGGVPVDDLFRTTPPEPMIKIFRAFGPIVENDSC